jgi:hypothetical protein
MAALTIGRAFYHLRSCMFGNRLAHHQVDRALMRRRRRHCCLVDQHRMASAVPLAGQPTLQHHMALEGTSPYYAVCHCLDYQPYRCDGLRYDTPPTRATNALGYCNAANQRWFQYGSSALRPVC